MRRLASGAVARIVLLLLVPVAAGSAVKLYVVQELIAGLLLVAIAVTAVFALTVGFISVSYTHLTLPTKA